MKPEGIIEGKTETLLIFSNLIGTEEVEKGLSYEEGKNLETEIDKINERVIAELTEEEQLFFRLMVYVSDQSLVDSREQFRLWMTFWSKIRAIYGFTESGDLGIRLGRYLVLCE